MKHVTAPRIVDEVGGLVDVPPGRCGVGWSVGWGQGLRMILRCHGSSTAAKDGKPEKGLFTPGLAILAPATPSDAGGVVYDVLLSGLTPSKGGGVSVPLPGSHFHCQ